MCSLWGFREVVKQTCQGGSAYCIWGRRSHTFRWAPSCPISPVYPQDEASQHRIHLAGSFWPAVGPAFSLSLWNLHRQPSQAPPAPSQTALHQFLCLGKCYLQWFPLPVKIVLWPWTWFLYPISFTFLNNSIKYLVGEVCVGFWPFPTAQHNTSQNNWFRNDWLHKGSLFSPFNIPL